MTELWNFEHELIEQGYELICGVDEAGRGPLAGPVCAAAVILPTDLEIEGLNDSKKLTEKKREALYDIIIDKALASGITLVSEKVIDEINILQATFLAMKGAVEAMELTPDYVLIDGNREPNLGQLAVKTIVKGDSRSANIAAASILAKVTRDRYMMEMDREYPQYGFAVHKGYGTRAHYQALEQHGPCPIHRMSFLKKFYGQ